MTIECNFNAGSAQSCEKNDEAKTKPKTFDTYIIEDLKKQLLKKEAMIAELKVQIENLEVEIELIKGQLGDCPHESFDPKVGLDEI